MSENLKSSINISDILTNYNDYENKRVTVTGKLESKHICGRRPGSVHFAGVCDDTGEIVIIVSDTNIVRDTVLNFMDKYTLFSTIKVTGPVCKSPEGSIAILVEEMVKL